MEVFILICTIYAHLFKKDHIMNLFIKHYPGHSSRKCRLNSESKASMKVSFLDITSMFIFWLKYCLNSFMWKIKIGSSIQHAQSKMLHGQ